MVQSKTIKQKTFYVVYLATSDLPARRAAAPLLASYIKVIIKEEPPQNFLHPSRPA
jgi:hypothetical protein